jgi:hypothetical protein
LIAANEEFLAPLDGGQRDAVASALRRLLLHHEPRRATSATDPVTGVDPPGRARRLEDR